MTENVYATDVMDFAPRPTVTEVDRNIQALDLEIRYFFSLDKINSMLKNLDLKKSSRVRSLAGLASMFSVLMIAGLFFAAWPCDDGFRTCL